MEVFAAGRATLSEPLGFHVTTVVVHLHNRRAFDKLTVVVSAAFRKGLAGPRCAKSQHQGNDQCFGHRSVSGGFAQRDIP
jgi:hypothetical protein